ncbi:MAG: 3-oxoacyl-ACP synthase III family protein [Anaerolineales bacterium]
MSKVIAGTGSDLPEIEVTNHDIERRSMDYDRERAGVSLDEWVMERVGVKVRHHLKPGEGTADMAARASRRALESAGLQPSDLDLIIMTTVSSDHRLPMSAAKLQAELGCSCKFFQLEHACSGFIDGLMVGEALMDSMKLDNILLVSSEAGSFILDPERFMLQTVFGDGAGAVILQQKKQADGYGLMALYSEADGSIGEWTSVPAGGTVMPITQEVLEKRLQYLRLDYKKIYPFAVKMMTHSSHVVTEMAGISLDEVDWVIPHQTGENLVLDVAQRLEIPPEKMFINVDHTGNTSGASIPIALDEANRAGLLQDGQILLMPTMGAGMTWGAGLIRWYGNGASGRAEVGTADE